MKKIDETNLFYAQQLRDVGVFDNDGSGLLSYQTADGATGPVLLKKKRLCLPTHDILKEGSWDNRIAFHPLSEQINCGPSDVLNGLKDYIRQTLSTRFTKAIMLLMHAASVQAVKTFSPKSMELMTTLADVDEKTYTFLTAVLKEISSKPEKRLLSMLLKTHQGGEYLRSTHVTFPILKDANSNDATSFFGVTKLRKSKDKRLITDLIRYVLGVDNDTKELSFGSNDRTAPFYHSLLLSFEQLAKQLNTIVDRHSGDVEHLDELRFSLAWLETFQVFSTFAKTNSIIAPPTPGNRGELIDSNDKVDASVYTDTTESTVREPELRMVDERDDRRDRDDRDDRRRDDRRDDRDERSEYDRYVDNLRGGGRDRDRDRDRDYRNDRSRDRGGRDDRRSRDRDRDRDYAPQRRDSMDGDYDSYMSRMRSGRGRR